MTNNSNPPFGRILAFLAIITTLVAIATSVFNMFSNSNTMVTSSDQQIRQKISEAWKLIEDGRSCVKKLIPENKDQNEEAIKACFQLESRGLNILESMNSSNGNFICSKAVKIEVLKNLITFYETSKNPDRFKEEIETLRIQINNLYNSK